MCEYEVGLRAREWSAVGRLRSAVTMYSTRQINALTRIVDLSRTHHGKSIATGTPDGYIGTQYTVHTRPLTEASLQSLKDPFTPSRRKWLTPELTNFEHLRNQVFN